MGRQTLEQGFVWDGSAVSYQHQSYYNVKGQLTEDVTNYSTGGGTGLDITHSYYTIDGMGNVSMVSTDFFHNLNPGENSKSYYTYAYHQGAEVAFLSQDPDTFRNAGFRTSKYNYLTFGGQRQLDTVLIDEGYTHTTTYLNDLSGQVLQRRDIEPATQDRGTPTEISYRMAGRSIGHTGNNGSTDLDYGTSIDYRLARPPGGNNFTYGNAIAAADFTQGITPISSGELRTGEVRLSIPAAGGSSAPPAEEECPQQPVHRQSHRKEGRDEQLKV